MLSVLRRCSSPRQFIHPILCACRNVRRSHQRASPADRLALLRNVGIISHVDAGKTTVCERMLYYAGAIHSMGEVHTGNTAMDHLAMERERGITVSSNEASFEWLGRRVRLIDTPGHIDFTVEVESSVAVIDAAVAIFDAVAGVQAQSETVWRQADARRLPRLAFVNKMDREGADAERTMRAMRERLGATPLAVQLPLGATASAAGLPVRAVADLVAMERVQFDDADAREPLRSPLRDDERDAAAAARAAMLDQLCSVDEQLLAAVLEADGDDVGADAVHESIRRMVLDGLVVPVFLGSALKNCGVQPLLDAIVRYLPPPRASGDDADIAYVYKVRHHHHVGLVAHCRVLAGALLGGGGKGRGSGVVVRMVNDDAAHTLVQVDGSSAEKVQRLATVQCGKLKNERQLLEGDIGAVVGLKQVRCGDYLVGERTRGCVRADFLPTVAKATYHNLLSYEVEPKSSKVSTKDLLEALDILSMEDPSFHFGTGYQLGGGGGAAGGSVVLHGQGALHLEKVRRRLSEHFGIELRAGSVNIGYRSGCRRAIAYRREFADALGRQYVLVIDVDASDAPDNTVHVPSDLDEASEKLLRDGVETALANGFVPTMPAMFTSVRVRSIDGDGSVPPETLYQLVDVLTGVARDHPDAFDVLEPIMQVDVSVPTSSSASYDATMSQLTSHYQAIVQHADEAAAAGPHQRIRALAPLRLLLQDGERAYANALRSATKGEATYTMIFDSYRPLPVRDAAEVLETLGWISPVN